jgi:ABC-type multidrug transport system fused ATPase/permease subunit
VERFLSRMLTSLAAAVAAIILVAAASVFLVAALYLFLVSMSVAPPLAALLVGLMLLMLAGLIILASRMAPRFRRTVRTRGNTGSADAGPARNVNDLAAQLGGIAAEHVTSQAQAHPFGTFATALLAGVAVGGSPELRNVLNKILKN